MMVNENVFWVLENIFALYVIDKVFALFFSGEYDRKTVALRICAYVFFYIAEMVVAFGEYFTEGTIIIADIVGCMLVLLTYEGNVKLKALIVSIIVVCEIISGRAVFLLNAFFRVSHENLINIIIFNLLLTAFATLIECSIKFENRVKSRINIIELLSVVITSMMGLSLMIIILDANYRTSEVVLGGVCLVVIHLLLILSMRQIEKNYEYAMENALVENENEIYRQQIAIIAESERRTRALRHDMKNHLVAISKLAERDSEMVLEYVNSLISSTQLSSQFSNTGNIVLDGIVNMKLGDVKDEDLDIDVKISVPDKIGVEPKDLVIVLGNLLDNSIRGVKGCEEKKFLKLCITMDRGRLMIELENSYSGVLKEKDGKLESTKHRKTDHGIGLDSVKATVKEYSGEIEVEHDGRVFRVRVVMYPEAKPVSSFI